MVSAKVFDVTIPDKFSLQLLFMPYLRGGGIFVPSLETYEVGDQVLLIMDLPDEDARCAVAGRVAWILPPTAHKPRKPAGIGIQFIEEESRVKARIENLLAGEIEADVRTLTM